MIINGNHKKILKDSYKVTDWVLPRGVEEDMTLDDYYDRRHLFRFKVILDDGSEEYLNFFLLERKTKKWVKNNLIKNEGKIDQDFQSKIDKCFERIVSILEEKEHDNEIEDLLSNKKIIEIKV